MLEIQDAAFDHLVEILHDPDSKTARQRSFDGWRFAQVLDALRIRPQFLPVQIVLPMAAQPLPLSGATKELNYDCIITGAITDGEDVKINLRRDSEDVKPFVNVGTEAAAQISLDAIAGKSLEATGKNGVQRLQPFLLRAGESLTVEVFKPTGSGAVDTLSLCFCGYQVLSRALAAENLTEKNKNQILNAIAARPAPEPRFTVCPVKFDAVDGTASAETPKSNEPTLIRGFRSTVKNALINVGFNRNAAFSREFFPIWALAAEAGNNSDSYRMLKSPIFLEPQQQLFFNLKNTINGVSVAENGQIEAYRTTV